MTYVKFLVVGMVLFAAAQSDIKSRRVPDAYWVLLVLSVTPLLIFEMVYRGAWESPATFLSLCLPAGFMVFVLFGYPEIKEIARGNKVDMIFGAIYLLLIGGTVVAVLNGDAGITSKIAFSFVFMMIYFLLYSVPIGGTRIIHGGADAKCMISLAAIFPWYGEITDISYGIFYELLADQSAMEFFFPFHFSVMLNGALVTVIFVVIFMPVRNIMKGYIHPWKMFTSYYMRLEEIPGKYVWVYKEKDGKKTKEDPTPEVLRDLREEGLEEVRVTPKIPFILSLAAGFVIQVVFGNLALLLILALT